MSKFIFFIACVVSSFLSNIASADFDLGFTYYEQKDFEQAYTEFYEAAKYGDHDAQNNIGAMYYRGEYVKQDKSLAYAWMSLAAQSEAFKSAGTHLKIFNKLSEPEKLIAEKKYKELLSEYGDQIIIEKITPTFTGESLTVQKQRRVKTVTPNYPEDMQRLGKSGFVDVMLTIDKDGFTKDQIVSYTTEKSFATAAIKAVRKWRYEPLLVNNKPTTVNGERVRIKFSIEGASADEKKLAKLVNELKQKAEAGDASSKFSYGYFLETIPSFAPQFKLPDNPNSLYLQSALAGHSAASYFLGRNILHGNLCTNDNEKSMGWLLKAAKSGLADAEYMLAIESFSGARFEKNEDKGLYWLKKAAPKYNPATLTYVWILVTHPTQEKRNGKLAAEMIAKIDDNYLDKQTLYKSRAAVAAENGDFSLAIKWQNKALEDAKDLDLPLDTLQKQLDSYNSQKPWREEI